MSCPPSSRAFLGPRFGDDTVEDRDPAPPRSVSREVVTLNPWGIAVPLATSSITCTFWQQR